MPTFTFVSPDGKEFDVEGPEGATEAQAFKILQQSMGTSAAPAEQGTPIEQLDRINGVQTPPAQTAESPSLIDQVGRQVGLTARAGIQGVTAIPNMVGDAIGLKSSQATSDALTSLGLPVPANATERIVQDMSGAMAGGGGIIALGKGMSKSAVPVVSRIGDLLRTQPMLQTVGNATGAGSAGITRENGGGPVAQTLTALAGSMAPVAIRTGLPMAAKGVFRGGEAGRQQTADNIKLFEEAGYGTPSAGQATESRFARGAESVLSKTPGSAGRMVAAAENGANNLGQSADDIANRLSPNANSTKAGAAIEKGVKGFVDRFKAVQNSLYDKLDQYIPLDKPISLTNTKDALAEINSDIKGAPNLSKWFKNAKIMGMESDLSKDLNQPGGIMKGKAGLDELGANVYKKNQSDTGIGATPDVILGGKDALPYEAIKKFRTLVGRELENITLTSDVPRSKWKALYRALSQDLESAAKDSGPEAEKAFSRANKYTRAGYDRINTYLDRVAGKDTMEKIFQAAVNPSEIREGASTINGVMRSLDTDSRSIVRSAFIKRLGTATAGNQDAAGEVFSPNTFLTNWNKISPEAKRILFAGQGGQVRSSLDKIAQVAENIRVGSKVFANPSGTQQAISAQAAGGGLFVALLTGNADVAAGIAGTAGAANLSARLLTNPDFVKWLAKSTATPRGAIPMALNQLSQLATKMQPEDQSAVAQFIQATATAAQSQETGQ